MILVTAKQMQEMDRKTITEFGIPGLVLMENAGRGALETLVETFDPIESYRVAIISGRGNNGGDGFVIGRYLMEMGVAVSFILLSERDKVAGDAKINMELVEALLAEHPESRFLEVPDGETFDRLKPTILHHDLFVDAIFGTGLNADVRGFFKTVIQTLNQSQSPVFSVDIPSGLNADTGKVCGTAIEADATATFAFAKAGHVLYPGNVHTGALEIIDIGIPGHIALGECPNLFLPEKEDIAALMPKRPFNTHKGSAGHLLTLAGAPGKTGAAALCANAAVRAGAGLVTLGVPQGILGIMESLAVEPMAIGLPQGDAGELSEEGLQAIQTVMSGKQVLAMGPGLGTHSSTQALIRALVEHSDIPMVIDADALNCLTSTPDIFSVAKAPLILTPHPGEMARLTGTSPKDIQADRLNIAIEFSQQANVILVLKGAQTLTACPDGTCYICPTGNPGMASGGMGDVLTGMIAGYMAQGMAPEAAAVAGVFIHGFCGDLLAQTSPVGFTASDMIKIIPNALAKILA
ncbi:MAG: bifunctional ADP-dependent NAD(P)H-hydrate dehydratase/NAD(P)H-hydrate epimerase [Desulfobacterales bacterium]|nr:MAG: bifunctional ADP-dependent NAD(P)H-hydrate dehydratase/NAD(P)H-hydrate epimerase [Desulfobacterales bacterium]